MAPSAVSFRTVTPVFHGSRGSTSHIILLFSAESARHYATAYLRRAPLPPQTTKRSTLDISNDNRWLRTSAFAMSGKDQAPLDLAPVTLLTLDFLERFTRVAEGVDAGGDAAIDGNLQQDLLDLVLGEPVLQRALHMQLQFMGTIEGAEHRQIDDAAGAPVEPRPGPERAPAELGRPLRHGAGEFIGARDRLVDVVLAQNFFSD